MSFFPSLLLVLAVLLSGSPSPGADEVVFHVSLAGDDAWSGSLPEQSADRANGPFATVHRAQQAVRDLIAAGEVRGRIRVRIGPGVHELARPLVFTNADSAPGGVVWEGDPGGGTVLSGGRRLSRWSPDGDGRWATTIPEVSDGTWNFAQLWVDGQRRFRSRLPAQGYFTVAAQIPPTALNEKKGHDRLGFRPGDIDPTWHALEDVEVMAFHIWSASRMRIGEIDTENDVLTFTGPTRTTNRWGAFPAGNRYFVDNVREALDEPGEWYLDRDSGVLTYVPYPWEDPRAASVVAPRLDAIVRLEGVVKERRFVEGLGFLDLTFAHTNWTLPPGGQSFPQAEVHLGAAIEAMGARGVWFQRCAVRHAGKYGLAFGAGCRHIGVVDCEIEDLGAGGIKIGTGGGAHSWMVEDFDRGDPESAVENVHVADCRIAHGGRLHPAAVGVWIGHASHCQVWHNDIRDFYYTGVSVGWTWGYAEPSGAHHNDIGWNRISQIGQGVLSDMAGVYTLGVSPGTRVHHNVIHDVDAFDYGGWGLYTDEGSTGIEMTHNVVYRTKTGGFHQHYGRENLVAHNVLVDAEIQQLQRTRTEEHLSFTFEKNIVVWTNESPLLGSNWKDDHFVLDRNLYWNPAHPEIRFPGNLGLEAWRAQRGHDRASIVADPGFLDPANDDYRLAPDSPALELGFEVWDHALVGPRDELPPVPAGFRR